VKNRDLKYRFLADFDREMLRLNRKGRLLEERYISRITENNHDKVIAFSRGDYLFVFNFHPSTSYPDYGIQLSGKYRIVLDTDDKEFGGFNRIDKSIVYWSVRKESRQTLSTPFRLYLYLPSRCAIVLKAEKIRRVNEI
jgi:1,4-alpha-glucan branching enzyme